MRKALFLTMMFILPAATLFPQKVFTTGELDSLMNPSVLSGSDDVLRFDRTSADAGTISEDDSPRSYIFGCRNVSRDTVVITRISTTCGCTEAVVSNPVIEPGGDARVRLVFNPFGHPGKAFLRAFVYSSLSSVSPIAVLTVSGEVTPSATLWKDYRYTCGPLKLRSKVFRAGQIRRGTVRTERIACANAGSRPLKISAAPGFAPGFITIRTEPQVLQPSEEGHLILQTDGRIPSGISGKRVFRILLEGIDTRPSERTIEADMEITE